MYQSYKPSDIVEIINLIEESFPVHGWKIFDIHVWPLIRFDIASKLRSHRPGNHPPPTHNRRSLTKQIKTLFVLLFSLVVDFVRFGTACILDYPRNQSIRDSADVIFLTHTRCRSFMRHAWYDKYCDPLIEQFARVGWHSLVLEWTPGGRFRIPRNQASCFINRTLNYVNLRTLLSLRAREAFSPHTLDAIPELRNFEDLQLFLQERQLGISLITPRTIRRDLLIIKELSIFFKKVLTDVRPKFALVVCYYSATGMALNLACHELRIPCVDIQHGRQGDTHFAYGRWKTIPKEGYELLPSVFWCWTDFEARAIQQWSNATSDRHKAIVGGNLFLEMWQRSDSDIVLYYDSRVAMLKKIRAATIHILLTLQPGLGFPDSIVRAIGNSSRSCFWWVRLHPGMLAEREKIRRLLERHGLQNTEMREATNLPLPALLRNVDVHITQCSSCVLDAEVFGVPSVTTNMIAERSFPEQFASGWAVLARADKDILQAIELQIKRRDKLRKEERERAKGISVLLSQLNG